MMAVNQRQMDLVLSSSSSSASNIDLVLAATDRLDQGSLGLDGKLDTIEQHLKQLVRVELRLRSFPSDCDTTTHYLH
jgi:hypothetical protein